MMTDTDPTTATAGPYGDAAMTYFHHGWAPLPLPARAKKHPPTGWTGAAGAWPSGADVHAWTEEHPAGNIALRLPPNVIGLDVDAYDNKPGGLVLAQLETQHGTLPPTWRSTSRDDGTSGIRFYTVPEGLRWPSVLGPGIETIRHGHRYAVAWPSIHPNGGTYRWITPDGTVTIGTTPTPHDLPELPHAWVAHFTGGELATDQARAGLTNTAATDWLTTHGQGPACRATGNALDRLLADLNGAAGARHDAALTGTNRIIWVAGLGHTGASSALDMARQAFLLATAGDRAPGEAQAEWDRMVIGAIDLSAAAHPNPPGTDPCTDPFAGLIDRTTQPCPPPAVPAGTPPTPTTATPDATAPPGLEQPASSDALAPTIEPGQSSPPTEPDAVERTTWWPSDPDIALDDDNPEPPPAFLTRDDGNALFYPGRVNGIVAPSESGKTWVVLLAVVQAANDGRRVTILDFEDSHKGITGRLRAMGLTKTQIRDHVAYIGPDEAFHPFLPTGRDLHEHLAAWQPELIVLDGFNAAMTLQGLDLMSNKDATTFAQTILKPLAVDGACVVYIDHTPKDTENKSSGGIGAQAKRAMTTGCALRVEIVKAFGKGQPGKIRLRVDKDRQGDVRGHSLPGKAGHWAGDVTIDPDGEHGVLVQLHAPNGAGSSDTNEDRAPFRPTALMERVSTFLAGIDDEGATGRSVRDNVRGKAEFVIQALDTLVTEGYVERHEEHGRGGARMVHKHVRPFVEMADPGPPRSGSPSGSLVVPGTTSSGSPRSGSPVPPPVGEPEPLQDPRAADEPAPNTPSGSRIVERTIGTERVKINLDTGEIIGSA